MYLQLSYKIQKEVKDNNKEHWCHITADSPGVRLYPYMTCQSANLENVDLYFDTSYKRKDRWGRRRRGEERNVCSEDRVAQTQVFCVYITNARTHTHTHTQGTVFSVGMMTNVNCQIWQGLKAHISSTITFWLMNQG